MKQHFSRLLNDKDSVRHFVNKVLKLDQKVLLKYKNIINLIVDAEIGFVNIDINSETLYSTKFRDEKYLSESDRYLIRKQIVSELLTLKRLDNDEKIKLLKGGALPNSDLKSDKQAYIIIGLPASGKSTIASKIADKYGAIILDSDFAKRKLPEFNSTHLYGATLVHKESSKLIFGFDNSSIKSVFETCLENQYNFVMPTVGENPEEILMLANSLKTQNEYDVHLISVELSKQKATTRAIDRFYKTKRYVPLGLIFDEYGNDTMLCYYFLRSIHSSKFNSFGSISTDVPLGNNPSYIDIFGESPVKNLFF